ncbi:efflux RND transporter periplasmic adaptor subunit [Candidatus Woesebacteria bacterium]|nr:efflux RND transporter periplasmic adaptor subunit [Candidatus Woesebacteria bacterium]
MKALFKRISKRWVIGILIIILIGGFFLYRSRTASNKPLSTAKVEKGEIEEVINVPGVVDADKKASLRFLAGGKIVSLPVKEGQFIKKSQALATMDIRDLQKNLQATLNDYMSERLDFEQDKDNREDLVKNDEILRLAQKSQLSLNNSVIAVELKDLAIRNATLYSPIDGVVTSLPISVAGVQVTATDTFEIVDPSTLIFEAEVDEIDIGRIHAGMPVRIVLDAYPDQPVESVIDYISVKAEQSRRSSGGTVFPIRIRFPISDLQFLRLGLNGTVSLILEQRDDSLLIPIEAVSMRSEKSIVMVKDPSNPQKPIEREVKLGIEGEDQIEVLEGLSLGDEVILPN